ncbi:MAG: oxygen-independent coproporphyrinogen III oxidase [Firmicutes bacterium]|nr:oxygen-independent coproporphyrinogen III oxidase [Bacillota bacterium]
MNREIGLYIHIPFCKRKCYYCDFNSYSNMEYLIPDYIKALKKEMEYYKGLLEARRVISIYIGGGTPTILTCSQLSEVVTSAVSMLSNWSEKLEITVEANPDTLSDKKLGVLKEIGVNRLSLGLQAYQLQLLERLGRFVSPKEFEWGFFSAREKGFSNINIDLIFGLPGQTLAHWEETLMKVIELKPEHISAYSLKIERGTRLYDEYKKGNLDLPDDESEREMYYIAKGLLKAGNYDHYEISNFAIRGYKCNHNLLYWKNREYIGLGAGAHSHFKNERYYNEENPLKYIQLINKGEIPVKGKETVTFSIEVSETLLMNLRLISGVNKLEFYRRFGYGINDIYGQRIESLKSKGLIEETEDHIMLTSLGLDLANEVFIELLP